MSRRDRDRSTVAVLRAIYSRQIYRPRAFDRRHITVITRVNGIV